MKKTLLGSTLILSGVLLFGMKMIAAVIFSQFTVGDLTEAHFALGWIPSIASYLLVGVGLVIALFGVFGRKE